MGCEWRTMKKHATSGAECQWRAVSLGAAAPGGSWGPDALCALPRCPRTSGEGAPWGAETTRSPAGGWGAGATSKPWAMRTAGTRTPAPRRPPSWPSGRSPCSHPSDRGRWETSKRKPPTLPPPQPRAFLTRASGQPRKSPGLKILDSMAVNLKSSLKNLSDLWLHLLCSN